jgi:hypothetical protein
MRWFKIFLINSLFNIGRFFYFFINTRYDEKIPSWLFTLLFNGYNNFMCWSVELQEYFKLEEPWKKPETI